MTPFLFVLFGVVTLTFVILLWTTGEISNKVWKIIHTILNVIIIIFIVVTASSTFDLRGSVGPVTVDLLATIVQLLALIAINTLRWPKFKKRDKNRDK